MKIPYQVQQARTRGRLATKELIGKKITCKLCSGESYVSEFEGRYFVICYGCGNKGYLKTYNV